MVKTKKQSPAMILQPTKLNQSPVFLFRTSFFPEEKYLDLVSNCKKSCYLVITDIGKLTRVTSRLNFFQNYFNM